MLLSPGRTRCPSPQPPSLLSTMCAVCTHTSPQAVSWPAPPRFSPESPSSSRWGGAGMGASWCLPAAGLLPVGRPLPSEPDEEERAPGVLSTAPGSAGQGRARRSPGFLPRPTQCYLVPSRESLRKGVSTPLRSEMEVRPLHHDERSEGSNITRHGRCISVLGKEQPTAWASMVRQSCPGGGLWGPILQAHLARPYLISTDYMLGT